jgi:hypothetical protein
MKDDDNDIDYDDVSDFNFTPIENMFVRSHKHQREKLEFEMRKRNWSYKRLVLECGKIINREITGTGQMSMNEASKCIETITGKRAH